MPHFSNCCSADEYICQSCTKIFCSKCSPSTWMPEYIGNTTAANVCPDCKAQYLKQVKNPTNTSDKKVWTKEEITNLLLTRKDMVERSLLKMWAFQTYSEQESKDTRFINGCGFNKPDGTVLSSFVENLKKYGSFKSDKQVAYVRKKLLKYTGQLVKIANGDLKEPEDIKGFIQHRVRQAWTLSAPHFRRRFR